MSKGKEFPPISSERQNAATYYADKTCPNALLDEASKGERDRWQTAYNSEILRLQLAKPTPPLLASPSGYETSKRQENCTREGAPASLGDEERAKLKYGKRMDDISVIQRAAFIEGLRTSRAELLAEVKRLKQECDDWEGSCSRQYSEITKLRAALQRIASLASYPLPTCDWKANMRLAQSISREALGAGHREGEAK